MNRLSAQFGGVVVLLLVLFSSPTLALDGSSVIGPDSVVCGFVAWEKLYDLAIDQLEKIDQPTHANQKALLVMLWPMTRPFLRSARGESPTKSCAANMRVLRGATEMYNMDHKDGLDHVDISKLTGESYLRSAVVCPSGGTYAARGDLTKDGVISCSKHGDVDHLISDDQADGPPEPPETIERLVADVLAFHRREVFRPRGGIWFSFDNDFRPRIVLSGSIKPKELHEFLERYPLPFLKFEVVDDHLVRFQIPFSFLGSGELAGEILADGLRIGTEFPRNPDRESWGEFLANAAHPETIYTAELDGKRLRSAFEQVQATERRRSCHDHLNILCGAVEMYNREAKEAMTRLDPKGLLAGKFLRSIPRCPEQGEYAAVGDPARNGAISCSIHGSVVEPRLGKMEADRNDPSHQRLWAISRMRALGTRTQAYCRARVENQQVRADLKALFEKDLKENQERLTSSTAGLVDMKQFVPALGKSEVVVQDDWVGVVVSGLDFGAVFRSVLVPSGKAGNEKPRIKDCPANLRVLTGAVEMYNMDHAVLMETLDIELLTKDAYLKEVPICPEGGAYSLGQPKEDCRLKCSIHGSLP